MAWYIRGISPHPNTLVHIASLPTGIECHVFFHVFCRAPSDFSLRARPAFLLGLEGTGPWAEGLAAEIFKIMMNKISIGTKNNLHF